MADGPNPLTILSTLPSAGLGALLTLMLVGRPLDVIGIIGIILLIGIVKKNGIMLVDVALEGQRHEGLSSEDAIHHACLLRFRPILMTTMCALFGGIPLMLGTGTGSEIRQPLGYAIVGGLLVSQVLTLFTTPIVFIYMDKIGQALSARVAPSPPLSPARCGPVDRRPQDGRAADRAVTPAVVDPTVGRIVFWKSDIFLPKMQNDGQILKNGLLAARARIPN